MKHTLIALTALVTYTLPSETFANNTYYVDNVAGNDKNEGIETDGATSLGPFQTLERAAAALKPGDTLEFIKNEEPYRDALRLREGGRDDAPLVINGNGAVIDLGVDISTGPWTDLGDGRWALEGIALEDHGEGPNQRASAFFKGQPVRLKREGIKPPFLEMDAERNQYIFTPDDDSKPPFNELILLNPPMRSAVQIKGQAYVTINDLITRHAGNDGFNIHGSEGGEAGKSHNITLQRVIAERNGDEGISTHGDSEISVIDSLIIGNGSGTGGVVDVHGSKTHYTNCIAIENYGPGFFFNGAEHRIESCASVNNGAPDGKNPHNKTLIVEWSDHFEHTGIPVSDIVRERLENHPLSKSLPDLD